jgi:hypothetical protein
LKDRDGPRALVPCGPTALDPYQRTAEPSAALALADALARYLTVGAARMH